MSDSFPPGIRTLTMSYLMDNDLMDNAPKLALNEYAPGGVEDDSLLRRVASAPGAEAQQGPSGARDVGNQMTSFEKESREGAAAKAPEHQQTQAEKEMREAARNTVGNQGPGESPGNGQVKLPESSVRKGERPFLEPQPNGDLRIGDDLFIRWKPLPEIGNAALGGFIGSAMPGGLFSNSEQVTERKNFWRTVSATHSLRMSLKPRLRHPWTAQRIKCRTLDPHHGNRLNPVSGRPDRPASRNLVVE